MARCFFTFSLCAAAVVLLLPLGAAAQVKALDIAQRYPLANESFQFGDIIVYDKEALVYRLAGEHSDPGVFGIAIESPVLLLDNGTTDVPIIRSGEALVNVVATNGPIAAGDYVTTSAVLGKGERANPEDSYVVGVALTPYAGLESEVVGTEGDTAYGQISVLLSVGHISKAHEELTGERAPETGITEATLLNVIQYALAAFIAVGSVFIAFRNFGPNIKSGIDSIGRNPLAKASIQSMIVLNVVLIVLISGGGLFVSLAILLLPI